VHVEPVIIIGAGPAGLATAIQLKHYGMNPLLLESTAVGGLLRNANWVENYPGFPTGISGQELAKLFEAQARNIGIELISEKVTTLAYVQDHFQVTSNSRDYSCRIVVIATGTKPRAPAGLEIPEVLHDRVFYEVFPLREAKGRRIAIIGAGDAAFDYALNLSRNNDVLILNRGTQVKCLPQLWAQVRTTSRITYHEQTVVLGLRESSTGEISLDCTDRCGTTLSVVDCLICAIGRSPQLDFVTPDLSAMFETLKDCSLLYQIGDVNNINYRQTAIAVGEGTLAAMRIYRKLQEIQDWKSLPQQETALSP